MLPGQRAASGTLHRHLDPSATAELRFVADHRGCERSRTAGRLGTRLNDDLPVFLRRARTVVALRQRHTAAVPGLLSTRASELMEGPAHD